ncbi:MAG: methylmalonyl Co-A mutase-associated GTPase MeaB [Anaerolineales bacterium]|nr:methylmalonyl Co-A mutase-associated GTPase MeaB [Anaerolineales bacterium]MCZ2289076.1 methylmalonyl Co-A mutase-associated GTPase MeaB [Anaerolineales bacterium]
MTLAESVLNGDRLALARLLTQVENDSAEGRAALAALFPRTGRAHLVGVTGAPGTGKSSLVNQLALAYRRSGKRVAILAVDPSSPFTGGAVLGDRVRMRDLAGDAGVFIRSMASRGSLGGLAQSTAAMTQVFDAAGFDAAMIETVGAGQNEVDIVRLAHTTIVVDAPGLGDDIQAIKAGILEIADVLVVNKADRPEAENTVRALKSMLDLANPKRFVIRHHGTTMKADAPAKTESRRWVPPIQRTVATEGAGVDELVAHIEKHAAYLRASGEWAVRERARLRSEVEALLREALMARFRAEVPDGKFESALEQVFTHRLSPWEAAQLLTDGRRK